MKEVYVYLTEVPEDKKEYIITNKRYKLQNCRYNQKGEYYTGDIDHELGYSWFILTHKCAHLHYADWEVEIKDDEKTKLDMAREVLKHLEYDYRYPYTVEGDRSRIKLLSTYTKEELEAILTLWEEL